MTPELPRRSADTPTDSRPPTAGRVPLVRPDLRSGRRLERPAAEGLNSKRARMHRGGGPLLLAGFQHAVDPFLDELLHAAVLGRGDDAELPRDRRIDVDSDVLLALAGDRCRSSSW